jgi:thiamine pyrophosphokinase
MDSIALIVLAGNVTADDLRMAKPYDFSIACDAGIKAFFDNELVPDVLLGDMDSIENNLLEIAQNKNITIARHPTHKDKSDGELAIDFAASKGFGKLTILGMFGGSRPDQVIFNFALFEYCHKLGVQAKTIADGFEIFHVDKGRTEIQSEPGMIVSVMPAENDSFVRLSGLEYPLDGLLKIGSTLGLSNVTKGNFIIESTGRLLLFVQRVCI